MAYQSPGMPIVSEKPDSRMSDKSSTFEAASIYFSSAIEGCILWQVDGKAAEKPVASRRKIQTSLTIPRLRPGKTKENLSPEQ